MRVVYKYPIEFLADNQDILLPLGIKILRVDEQNGNYFLWGLIDTEAVKRFRAIYIVGTGHEAPNAEWIGTVMSGPFVWHFFLSPEQR